MGNREFQQTVAKAVIERVTNLPLQKVRYEISSLMRNYFSFVFSITTSSESDVSTFFVKIPKEDLRQSSNKIAPLSKTDLSLAEEEVNSLRLLADQWQSEDLAVSWVNLRDYLPWYNAIVTDAVGGKEALELFRKWDLSRRIGFRKGHKNLIDAMSRLGKSLGRFHQANSTASVFKFSELMPKLKHYCIKLESITGNSKPGQIIEKLNALQSLKIDTIHVPTLKGIDIRNILVNKDNGLYLLDPGKVKYTYCEADLARFVMTYRILYWGSSLFFLGLQPDPKAEESFLDSYYAINRSLDIKLFRIFMIKEQLKHWHTALTSLAMRPWSKLLREVVAATYVNPYYIKQLSCELKTVTK